MLQKSGWQLGLVVVILFGSFIRLWGLGSPDRLVFDEIHHSSAASVIVGIVPHPGMGAWSTHRVIGRSPDPSFIHPPLGKLLIGSGIWAFGNESGWGRRLPCAFFGIFSLALFFLIGRELLNCSLQATVAVALLSFDGLHIVQSRTGMLDIFMFAFGLMGYLGLLKMLQEPEAMRWRVFAGLSWGLAMAVKLNSVLGAFGCTLLWLLLSPLTIKRRTIALLHVMVLASLICVFIDSIFYIAHGFTVGNWIELRTVASTTLMGEFKAHPYESSPGEWLWNRKAIWYSFEQTLEGTRGIVAMGNPIVWLAFLPASYIVFASCHEQWRKKCDLECRKKIESDLVPLVWFLSTYLPMHIILWRHEGFLYYMLPSTAPMCLIITRSLFRNRPGKHWIIAAYLLLVAATLVAMIPVFLGITVPDAYFNQVFKFISV